MDQDRGTEAPERKGELEKRHLEAMGHLCDFLDRHGTIIRATRRHTALTKKESESSQSQDDKKLQKTLFECFNSTSNP